MTDAEIETRWRLGEVFLHKHCGRMVIREYSGRTSHAPYCDFMQSFPNPPSKCGWLKWQDMEPAPHIADIVL